MRKRVSDPVIVLILGSLATVSPFSIDMYLPSFSQIATDFDTTTARVSLSISSYFIGLAIGQLLYGPLMDRFGRKKPLYAGLIAYVIASIACMLSRNIEELIFFRFIQAVGGCAASVAAMSMVRDFFPVKESAKVFSLLVLILGVSPLLAPTAGGFITTYFGWHSVFIILAVIVAVILFVVKVYLPQGSPPDKTISLKAKPILLTFYSVLSNPQFYTYALAGAFSFASLFLYVAGSPVIFLENFQVTPKVYGGIFALLSVGFIGSNQLNIFALKYANSQKLFSIALQCQVVVTILFFITSYYDLLGMPGTIVMFFLTLSCLGFIIPNASALALAPFSKNAGSAAALIGCIQIGIAALASGSIGLFNSSSSLPITGMMAVTAAIAFVILKAGEKNVGIIEESSADSGAPLH